MSVLSQPHMHDEAAAFAHVEAMLWPNGPVCPKCGNAGEKKIYVLEGVRTKPSKKHPEGKVRHGLKKCGACRKQFTVRIGTIFEESHLDLHLWLQAIYLMTSSKKGISSNQLHRTLGVTLKTAWFLSHRIREAMRTGDFKSPLGGSGKQVESDETYFGNKKGAKKKRGYSHKMAALSLVERGGDVRSFHIDRATVANVKPIVDANLDHESQLMTDEASIYRSIGKAFEHHFTVEHGDGEYVRGQVHTNTLEGYFSIFKRGMKGVYQHCDERHLHRYLAEFDFRYNKRVARGVDDKARADSALRGVVGRRLRYKTFDEVATL